MFVRDILRKFRLVPLQMRLDIVVGLAIILLILLMAVLADLAANPLRITADQFRPPSPSHLFGTDQLGRDVFSRIAYGGRVSLVIALLGTIASLAIATPVALIAGYVGGKVDGLLTLVTDAIFIFPTLVLALLIAAFLSTNPYGLVLAVSISFIPATYRVIRSITLSIKQQPLVEGEISLGASSLYIVRKHVFPRTLSSLIVLASVNIAQAVLIVSSLGFLGLGVQPPTPEWGTDLNTARQFVLGYQWWLMTFPGLFIFLTVIGFNMLGEVLSELSNPRLRGR